MGQLSITGSRRVSWGTVPARVRDAVEERLGSPVAGAVDLAGGFSEGVAARLRLADGRDVFVKAAAEPVVAGFHRREGGVAARLPRAVPSPLLLFALAVDPWVVLGFEFVAGRLPARPWRDDELRPVLDAATRAADALTPAPFRPSTPPRLGGWAGLAADAVARVSPWAGAHLERLVALEAAGAHTLAGDTLLHGDLYAFNVLLDEDRKVYLVDWPHAWVGAAHCDVLTLMSTAADPEPLLAANPLTAGLEPFAVDAFLAAHSGFLVRLAVTATGEADPNLVAMAAALGRGSLAWLSQRPYSAT
ncbi:phosphotransferase family protein [Dactylosporangium sp. CA-233914]|uniref:phosphotransferase family protein n=1 Tax=Dactylosporangium sp. CA-233914 TaxID=3239934 RepID=UPI003D94953E